MKYTYKSSDFLLLWIAFNVFSLVSVCNGRENFWGKFGKHRQWQRQRIGVDISRPTIHRKLKEAEKLAKQNSDSVKAISFLASPKSMVVDNRHVSRDVSECEFEKSNTDPCTSPYREHSGRCSNDHRGRRSWGMAGTVYERILPPKYETDGFGDVRTTEFSSGRKLKSARKISTVVMSTDVMLNHNGVSAHVMQFGQFVAHDFTRIADSAPDAECCPDKLNLDLSQLSNGDISKVSNNIKTMRPSCMQIENFNDAVYGRYHCIRLTRSFNKEKNDCSRSIREQVNSISHVIDASNVYGSSLDESRRLRALIWGRLKNDNGGNGMLLPPDRRNCATRKCPFLAGDERVTVTRIEQCIRGLTEDKPWKVDRFFPTQMRDQLFRLKQDIVSMNIQRGRDHGFASYLDYRRHFGLSVPRNWNDLHRTHPSDVVERLKGVYSTVEDIELYPGGITENPYPGGLVGELFGRIIGLGFRNLRDGDRFYFDSASSGLTPAQKRAIKRYTYAHLLCDGSDIDEVPSMAFFRFSTPRNFVRRERCSDLRGTVLLNNMKRLWGSEQTTPKLECKVLWPYGKCCKGKRLTLVKCPGEGSKSVFRKCWHESSGCK